MPSPLQSAKKRAKENKTQNTAICPVCNGFDLYEPVAFYLHVRSASHAPGLPEKRQMTYLGSGGGK